MFLGASLEPAYFEEKVNLFVALGPVSKLGDGGKTKSEWRQVEYLAKKFGAYNLLNLGWLEEDAAQLFCEATDICYDLIRMVADSNTDVDDLDRFYVFMKDFPAGNGYQNLVFYA